MAIIKFINKKSKHSGTIAHLKNLSLYSQKNNKAENKYISCYNCIPETAFEQFINTKQFYNKTKGRNFIHFIQSFAPTDPVTLKMAHEIACQLTKKYENKYEVLIATHKDTKHIHTHIIINSVALDGRKFQQSAKELQELKNHSDRLCIKYKLPILNNDNKSNNKDISYKEFKAKLNNTSWKRDLTTAIDYSLEKSNTKYNFIDNMNKLGYKVKWTDNRTNITYTTPNNISCRDTKLSNTKYLKINMEKHFLNRELIKSSTTLLNELTCNNDNVTNCSNNYIELSKQAKREIYTIQKDKSHIWDKEH